MVHDRSAALFDQARALIPGGVNSPVRAFASVGTTPIFVERAHGSRVTDVDGNTYLDYIGSWGPMLFGHSPDFLLEDLAQAAARGTSYGLPAPGEVEMARLISAAYPAAEMVRMVNSGTEATMSAIRVARGYTGRDKVVKFEGCYHGHSDCLLVKSGSGALTFGVPTSPGVPAPVVKDTLVCRYNHLEEVRDLFAREGEHIACVIVEPIAGNMGLVPGKAEFLRGLREVCTQYGAVLIFDEVISGFRAALGGAAEVYGIQPDLVCFGKIIGGGLPVGAYGGRREIMEYVSPVGPVYQAGTLSGNPLAMHLGCRMLRRLDRGVYDRLEEKGALLEAGIRDNLKALGLELTLHRQGSLLCLFFTQGEVDSYDQVSRCNTKAYARYFRSMLEQGILLPPSQFECMFLSDAHTREDIARTVQANRQALEEAMACTSP